MNSEIPHYKGYKHVLIMCAVAKEQEAVLQGLGEADGFDVRIAGVGPAAAAASTATYLAKMDRSHPYDLVISAGIGGGFPGIAGIGSIVIASQVLAADLGAESQEGFISVDKLGFGSSIVPVETTLSSRLFKRIAAEGLSVHSGPVLTLSTVTGTLEMQLELSRRIPGAAAEAMEGYGVAIAASMHHLPFLEIRAISNPVGPRDREQWKIKDALQALTRACSILPEVLSS